MSRLILTIMAVAVLAASAWAYPDQWEGQGSGTITVSIDIGCWIQTFFEDDDIVFDLVTDPDYPDWYYNGATVEGFAYAACPDGAGKTPSDPWAGYDDSGEATPYYGTDGCFYESRDGARWYIRSNNPLYMTVTTHGDLWGQECEDCPGEYIPTWFTLAGAPFMESGIWHHIGQIPLDQWGTYFGDDLSGGFTWGNVADPEHLYPTQNCFPCGPGAQSNVWTATFCPGLEGTLQWLARIQRFGFADQGASYSTTIDVAFTSPGMTPP
jgi:hypothetical protein